MEKILIVNKTPHTVYVYDDNTILLAEYQPDSVPVRIKADVQRIGDLAGIPLTSTVYGDLEGLPDEQSGVYYIVSGLVKAACPERKDLLVPSEQLRDEQGRVIGCKSFSI